MHDVTVWAAIFSAGFCLVSLLLYNSSRPVRASAQVDVQGSVVGDVDDVGRVFWIALGLRLLLGVLIAATETSDFFAPDRWGYETIGRMLAGHWAGGGPASSMVTEGAGLYHYYNGVFFFFFGDLGPWIVRSLNAVVGAAAVPLVYRIAASVYGRVAALRAAWFVALFPSMALWSALNIRDAWAGFAILIIVLAAMRLREQISGRTVVSLVAGLALLGGLRGYMFLLVAGAVVLAYVASLRGSLVRNYIAGVIVALAFLYLYNSLEFGKQMVETASFETLNSQRQGMTADAASAFYEDVDISTPGKAFAFLPIGMTFFLFAPFPWMLRNFRQLITLPEMIVWWYLALRFLIPGIREGLRVRIGHTTTICSVALLSVMAYGLVEGNVGTAYRHRAQVLPLLLILAAGGWAAAKRPMLSDEPRERTAVRV